MVKRRNGNSPYYVIWRGERDFVQKVIETHSPFDDAYFANGNYFASEEGAKRRLREIKRAERAEYDRQRARERYGQQQTSSQLRAPKRSARAPGDADSG